MLGGALVAVIGARHILLLSALATLGFGAAIVLALVSRRR